MSETLLHVRGDRLDLGILDGDTLLVREQQIAADGQIVVTVQPDGSYRLARYDGTARITGLVLTVNRRILGVVL